MPARVSFKQLLHFFFSLQLLCVLRALAYVDDGERDQLLRRLPLRAVCGVEEEEDVEVSPGLLLAIGEVPRGVERAVGDVIMLHHRLVLT